MQLIELVLNNMRGFEIPTEAEKKEIVERQYNELQEARRIKTEEIINLMRKAEALSAAITNLLIGVFGTLDNARAKSGEKITKTRLRNREHQVNIGKIQFARKKIEALKKLSQLTENLNIWLKRVGKMYYGDMDNLKFSLQNGWLKDAEALNNESNEYANW